MMTKRMIIIATVAAVLLCGASTSAAALQKDLESKLRAFIPKVVSDSSTDFPDRFGQPLDIDIIFAHVDMEGTNRDDFVVAVYTNDLDTIMRLFQKNGEQISLVADLDESLGGGRVLVRPEDVDTDNRPELVVEMGAAAGGHALKVVKWTGSNLTLLNPDSEHTNRYGNASLEDIDGDGVLEIITPPAFNEHRSVDEPLEDSELYHVYRFNGLLYELESTSETDPTKSFDAEGNARIIYSQRTFLKPNHFILKHLSQTIRRTDSSGGIIIVRSGNLFNPIHIGIEGGVSNVMDVDRNTLVLDRTIRPTRTFIRPAEKGKADLDKSEGAGGFDGPFLELHFNRSDVLELLPRLQLNKPLEPCDVLTLEIKGKMIDGAPFRAFAPVTITGPGGKAACEQANANRPPTRP